MAPKKSRKKPSKGEHAEVIVVQRPPKFSTYIRDQAGINAALAELKAMEDDPLTPEDESAFDALPELPEDDDDDNSAELTWDGEKPVWRLAMSREKQAELAKTAAGRKRLKQARAWVNQVKKDSRPQNR